LRSTPRDVRDGDARPEARTLRAAIAFGLRRGHLYGARALGAGLDFERNALAAGEAIEIEGSDEAAAVEEVFFAVFGGNESEAAIGYDLLDGSCGHN
jgi:hypothetical protein